MKKNILAILVIILAAAATGINAQEAPPPPAVPDAPVLRDDSIRMRSVELERVKREAAKRDTGPGAVNEGIDKKYPEIKEDFEGMQFAQMEIVKAYTMSDQIDYEAIASAAGKITKHARRLDSNLFVSKIKDKKKEDEDEEKAKSVRDLIVELDNAIGRVATSKMFQNLRVVDPEIAKKTQLDLYGVMRISTELAEEAEKMK